MLHKMKLPKHVLCIHMRNTYYLCDMDSIYNTVEINYLPIMLKSRNHEQLLFIERSRFRGHTLHDSSITWQSRYYMSSLFIERTRKTC